MPLFSNIDQVGRWLEATIKGIGFNIPASAGFQSPQSSPGGTLGDAAAVAVAEGIQDRSLRMQKGATQPFRPNSPDYAAWKLHYYRTDLINFRTFQMISMPSLTANIDVSHEIVTMRYGTDSPPRGGKSGIYKEWDDATDTQKAQQAHIDGRNFFEVDQDIANNRVLPIVGAAVADFLQRAANR